MEVVNTAKAYNFIRDKILAGIYKPGLPLVTRDLSKLTGVSRTPVRDALRQLESDGLVTVRAHLGATVKSMDLEQFKDLCELRQGLETYSAGLAAKNRTMGDLEEMRRAMKSMREIINNMLKINDPADHLPDLIREDVRFHYAIATASKNKLLKQEILRLNLVHRVVSMEPIAAPIAKLDVNFSTRRKSLAHHQRIYRAIAAGDVSAARKHTSRAIQDTIDLSLRLMADADEQSRSLSMGLPKNFR